MTGAEDQPIGRIGVVAIGRNEGERLRRCLESVVGRASSVVYVDSGSTDGSVDMAESLGVDVVALDLNVPFTAARARNAGVERLAQNGQGFDFIQVVDGDCTIVDGWLERAVEEMNTDDRIAVVCGRRREQFPEASRYNQLCDMEWNTPIGEAKSCGGDALIRFVAFEQVGGYDPTVIAGEEPEMCFRMRQEGWSVRRIDAEMTLHDARMTSARQWWKRSLRSGHASAEACHRYGRTPERFAAKQVRSVLIWALLLPIIALAAAWFTWGASLVVLIGLYGLQWFRIRRHRIRHGDPTNHASAYATHCLLGKFPELCGMMKFWSNRMRGRRSTLIEYKGASQPAESAPREETT